DGDRDADEEEDDPDDVEQDRHPRPPFGTRADCRPDRLSSASDRSAALFCSATKSRANSRAQASATRTVSTVCSAAGSCAARARASPLSMPVKAMSPEMNAATSTSLAALSTAGKLRPRRPASMARPRAGNARWSTGSNDQGIGWPQLFGTAAEPNRVVDPSACVPRA